MSGKTKSRILADVLFLLSLALLLFAWLWQPATCSASGMPEEQTRVITMAELNRLDNIFSQLSQDRGKLQNELTDSRTELLKSQVALKQARRELTKLQLQLAELKTLSAVQETSLQKANESLQQFATEEKKTRLRLKAQRNLWQGVALISLAVVASK